METETKKSWSEIRQGKGNRLVLIVLMVLMALAQYFALDLSCGLGADRGLAGVINEFLWRPWLYHGSAMTVILLLDLLLILIFGRLDLGLALSSFATMALSIGNHFVYALHGTPFTFSMLKNTGTALDVLQSYTLSMNINLALILIIGLGGIAASLILGWKVKISRVRYLIPTAVFSLFFVISFVIPSSLIPKNVVGWSWDESVVRYGYLNVLGKTTIQGEIGPQKPDDYDEEALMAFTESYQPVTEGSSKPDVILILNETFFDLNQVTDLQADQDVLKNIRGLSNAVTGYAVEPSVGGGTNKSEYEYLTSNSLQVAPNLTPFNAFEMQDANSVVSLMEAQGYETQAIHSEPGANYNRMNSYPAMGFDSFHFKNDFEGMETYGNRTFRLDSSVYENMLRWYEQMGEGPRFFYTLTIQNHGGYDRLSPDQYLVHTGRDFGENTNLVNEFLTMISLSDQAFLELTQYFEDSDRDVIICMVGDHGPAFIRNVTDPELPQEQRELRMRSVPYVIWSNHIPLTQQLPERISMNYLTPSVLQMADVQLSPYYDFLVNLRQRIPVLGAYGSYVTEDGSVHSYEGGDPDARIYLGLSYANISRQPFMKDFTAPIEKKAES